MGQKRIDEKDLESLNAKVKNFGQFDKGLELFRVEIWKIADKYQMDGKDVVMAFWDWKSKNKDLK